MTLAIYFSIPIDIALNAIVVVVLSLFYVCLSWNFCLLLSWKHAKCGFDSQSDRAIACHVLRVMMFVDRVSGWDLSCWQLNKKEVENQDLVVSASSDVQVLPSVVPAWHCGTAKVLSTNLARLR